MIHQLYDLFSYTVCFNAAHSDQTSEHYRSCFILLPAEHIMAFFFFQMLLLPFLIVTAFCMTAAGTTVTFIARRITHTLERLDFAVL